MFKHFNIGNKNINIIEDAQNQYFKFNKEKLTTSQISAKRYKQKQKQQKSMNQQVTRTRQFFYETEKQQASNDCNQILKNKFLPITQSEEQMQDKNEHFKNLVFLAKIRRLGEKMKTQGVSVYSPQCLQIPEELYEEEYKGLHKFSNIAIKRLQKKCKKVSFSEFLDAKRENDWRNKAKYSMLVHQSKLSPQKNKKSTGVQALYLGYSPSQELNQNNQEDILRQNKSMNVYEAKRHQGKVRLQKCKTRERYSSIPALSPTMGIKLQISRVNLCHPE